MSRMPLAINSSLVCYSGISFSLALKHKFITFLTAREVFLLDTVDVESCEHWVKLVQNSTQKKSSLVP